MTVTHSTYSWSLEHVHGQWSMSSFKVQHMFLDFTLLWRHCRSKVRLIVIMHVLQLVTISPYITTSNYISLNLLVKYIITVATCKNMGVSPFGRKCNICWNWLWFIATKVRSRQDAFPGISSFLTIYFKGSLHNMLLIQIYHIICDFQPNYASLTMKYISLVK